MLEGAVVPFAHAWRLPFAVPWEAEKLASIARAPTGMPQPPLLPPCGEKPNVPPT